MFLSESLENYLEAIFEIGKRKRTVRVKDVANRLNVSMPSVNSALKNLHKKGFINYQKYEYIELTDAGVSRATVISDRHKMLYTFLRDILGVDQETADHDACKLEHDLSAITLEKLSDLIDKNIGEKH